MHFNFQVTFTGLWMLILYFIIFSSFSLHHSFLKYGHLWKAKDGNLMLNQISQVSDIIII